MASPSSLGPPQDSSVNSEFYTFTLSDPSNPSDATKIEIVVEGDETPVPISQYIIESSSSLEAPRTDPSRPVSPVDPDLFILKPVDPSNPNGVLELQLITKDEEKPVPISQRIFDSNTAFDSVIFFLAIPVYFTPVAPLAALVQALAAGHLAFCKKEAVYEVTLFYKMIRDRYYSKEFVWWHNVTDKIILSAQPLSNWNDHETLTNDGVEAVLCMLQDYEMNTKCVFSDAVTEQQWKKVNPNVDFLQIRASDFDPLTQDQIDQSVAFMEKNKKTVVHCKAGAGRSATAVIAHMFKNGHNDEGQPFKTMEEAHQFVKAKRFQVNMNSRQRAALDEYAKRIRPQESS